MTIGAGTIGATPVGGVQRRGEARTATVSVTDADTLTTTGARARTATATIRDTDTVVTVTTRSRSARLTLADTDTLTTVGTTSVFSARLRDTDTIASAGTHTRTGESSASDTDTLTVTATRPRVATSTPTDTDTLTATGAHARIATATATDTDTLAGVGSVARTGMAALADADTLMATGVRARSGVVTPRDTDTVATTATLVVYQNEVRWLLGAIADAWPGGEFPADAIRIDRDDSVNVATGERALGFPTDSTTSIGVSSDRVEREPRGQTPIDRVETTLSVHITAKAAREWGSMDTVAEFDTFVARVRHAINSQIVYPTVTPGAQDRGRVDYEDCQITQVEPLSDEFKDRYRTNLTVLLRGFDR